MALSNSVHVAGTRVPTSWLGVCPECECDEDRNQPHDPTCVRGREIEEERIAAEIAKQNAERDEIADTEPAPELSEVDADYDAFAGVRKGYALIDEFCRIGANDRVECFRRMFGRIPIWQGMKRHLKRMPSRLGFKSAINPVKSGSSEVVPRLGKRQFRIGNRSNRENAS